MRKVGLKFRILLSSSSNFLIKYLLIIFKKSTISLYINKLVISLNVVLAACQSQKDKWAISIEDVTSSSSPMCIDLNNDHIIDIVIGAGAEEWQKTTAGIIAINGKDGQILWKAKARNQIVGTAIFLKINDDDTPDIIIGGRSAELQALDGKSGKLIWEFYSKPGKLRAYDEGWFNFFNPLKLLDQNGDGIADFLICNGGNALIASGGIGRQAGRLLLISGKTGQILAEDTMPDGAETYFSPVCFDCENSKNPKIIFGSGGETQPGHLYLIQLEDLLQKKLSNAKIIDVSEKKGYIAPPILSDFNNDKNLDILVNLVDGKVKLIDGKSLHQLWSVACDSSESYSRPAVGNFDGNDNVPDVFVNFAKGTYPNYSSTVNYTINGKTGKVVAKKKGGQFSYSSPLVADLDNDGIDEVIQNTILDYEERKQKKPYYQLSVYNFKKNTESYIGEKKYGACFASTPWLGDIDENGKLDIIYSGSPAAISSFPGTTTFVKPPVVLNIYRFEAENYLSKSVKWGSYMENGLKSISK